VSIYRFDPRIDLGARFDIFVSDRPWTEKKVKKRDRSKAELNHDEFDIESPDRKTRAISDTALAYRDPVTFRGDETRWYLNSNLNEILI